MRIVGLALALLTIAVSATASPILDQSFSPTSRLAIATIDSEVMWAESFRAGETGTLADVSLLLIGGRGQLMVDIIPVRNGWIAPLESQGRVTVSGSALPQDEPGWVTFNFAPLAIEVVAGESLAILLQTQSPGASFNWYGDYSAYPFAMSWVSMDCCGPFGNGGTTFGFQTTVETDPAASPIPEPTSMLLFGSAGVALLVRRRRGLLTL